MSLGFVVPRCAKEEGRFMAEWAVKGGDAAEKPQIIGLVQRGNEDIARTETMGSQKKMHRNLEYL